PRTPAESTALAHGERWTLRNRARSSDQDCLYSVSVRQVAALLPRFFQTPPRDGRPCASLALCLTGPGQRTFTSKLSNMLGTLAAVDAENAPTAAWKTRRRVSHTAHRRPRTREKQEEHDPRLRAGKESDDTHATY